VVTRLAGDEFCILLDDIHDGSDATRVARRILELLGEPVHLEGRTLFTGCSIGIAVSEADLVDPEHLLQNADTAMYRAKTGGRGRFEVFDRSMHDRAMEQMKLETDIQEGLRDHQFRLAYMPVVELETGKVVGLEALLRWEHPTRGAISPEVFVPVAEESGAIVPMGWWVLDRACQQMADWGRRHPAMSEMTVSVNLSAKQLRQPDLLDRVASALAGSGLAAERLLLEVSEVALMEEPDWHEEALLRLGEMGVNVQVDDFGTGTSSLSYLGRFKVSTLKIDRSFIQLVDQPDEQSAIVQAIITLARNLGIHVIAEGIETAGQGDRLRSLQCDQGQGYLFSRPIEEDAVPALLTEARPLQRV
jgi:predicted signal transduction protein with EAL and GGDEF domain